MKNTDAVFVGPKMCGDVWASWGVPEKRIVRLKPGQSYRVKDTEIVAVESFDRTVLITPPPAGDLRGKMPVDMDERAVNYVIKTPGGSIYHSGDSHFPTAITATESSTGSMSPWSPTATTARDHGQADRLRHPADRPRPQRQGPDPHPLGHVGHAVPRPQ